MRKEHTHCLLPLVQMLSSRRNKETIIVRQAIQELVRCSPFYFLLLSLFPRDGLHLRDKNKPGRWKTLGLFANKIGKEKKSITIIAGQRVQSEVNPKEELGDSLFPCKSDRSFQDA